MYSLLNNVQICNFPAVLEISRSANKFLSSRRIPTHGPLWQMPWWLTWPRLLFSDRREWSTTSLYTDPVRHLSVTCSLFQRQLPNWEWHRILLTLAFTQGLLRGHYLCSHGSPLEQILNGMCASPVLHPTRARLSSWSSFTRQTGPQFPLLPFKAVHNCAATHAIHKALTPFHTIFEELYGQPAWQLMQWIPREVMECTQPTVSYMRRDISWISCSWILTDLISSTDVQISFNSQICCLSIWYVFHHRLSLTLNVLCCHMPFHPWTLLPQIIACFSWLSCFDRPRTQSYYRIHVSMTRRILMKPETRGCLLRPRSLIRFSCDLTNDWVRTQSQLPHWHNITVVSVADASSLFLNGLCKVLSRLSTVCLVVSS
jgi:hypothetical protein